MAHLSPVNRTHFGNQLANLSIYYLSQLTTPDQKALIPWHNLNDPLPPRARKNHQPPWHKMLQEHFTGSPDPTMYSLLPAYSPPPYPAAFEQAHRRCMAPPRPHYGSIPFEEPVFSRLLADGTPNHRVPQVWVSDGSGRHLKSSPKSLSAGCSLLPVQNAYKSLQPGRVAGKQSVYKSELLALVTAAETPP